MAVLIIGCALFRIRQYRIGLPGFLELGFGVLVAWICVRMVFLGQLPVCFFDSGIIGVFIYAEHLIIISFFSHIFSFLNTFLNTLNGEVYASPLKCFLFIWS